jgi:RimJ/RimL family protein N-acetyltransferase
VRRVLTIARFTGEYAPLAAWTGEPVEELRAQDDLHDDDRYTWLAWDGPGVVGVMSPWVRPDGRHTLYFGRCRDDAYAPLAAAVPGTVLTTAGSEDTGMRDALAGAGFAELRREHLYEIPVRNLGAPAPAGYTIVTADRTELEPLMLLDCALREDVPGSEGWQPDPRWFREETYDSPYFDQATYRVALDGDGGYVGLARIWNGPQPRPHLGMIGVLRPYRRLGLARALLAAAFAPLVARGAGVVTADVDAENVPSNTLMTGLGGTVTGGTVELIRT